MNTPDKQLPRMVALAAVAAFGWSTQACAEEASKSAHTKASKGDQLVAIWDERELRFEYTSVSVLYSCKDLGRRVLAILQALGVREDSRALIRCNGDFSRRTVMDLQLAVPIEATSDNVEIATRFNATERLIARVRQTALPTANDIERFVVEWQEVDLTRRAGFKIRYQDCDLLQDMREQLFPKLDIRVAAKGFRCDSTSTHVRPRVVLEALLPARVARDI